MSNAAKSHEWPPTHLHTGKYWINPIDYLRKIAPKFSPDHLTFDPTLNDRSAQYRVIRSQSHDGTMMFTDQLIADALAPLAYATSYYKCEPAPADALGIRYRIGLIRLAITYGRVQLPAGLYLGQRESVCIPVIATWVTPENSTSS